MFAHAPRIVGAFFIASSIGLLLTTGQEPFPLPQGPEALQAPAIANVPQGVDVQARGPVHEAFATPTTEPQATRLIAKKPPAPLEELPPEEKPEGDVSWIPGYWAWDDDRTDFLWVSGCWRVKPTGKDWVPGYWREQGDDWQWVSGFWANTTPEGQTEPVTYYPPPPAQPQVAPPGDPPQPDNFFVPGYQMWTGDRYVYRAGYWTRIRPGYVYISSTYRWTPYGYVFVPGYWDLAMSRRGILYAPVVFNAGIQPGFVYTPAYAVSDTMMMDAMFVRPAYGCYYFGDYYGPRYLGLGFESHYMYSRRHYEPFVVYHRWEHRDNPRWFDSQVHLHNERVAGRAPLPIRNLAQQAALNNKAGNGNHQAVMLAPAKTVMAAQGQKIVPLTQANRAQVHQTTLDTHHTLAVERKKTEAVIGTTGTTGQPRVNTFKTPISPAVSNIGTLPKATTGAPGSGAKTITTLPNNTIGSGTTGGTTGAPGSGAKTITTLPNNTIGSGTTGGATGAPGSGAKTITTLPNNTIGSGTTGGTTGAGTSGKITGTPNTQPGSQPIIPRVIPGPMPTTGSGRPPEEKKKPRTP